MPNEKAFPFRIGADPEFNFVVQNRQSGRLRADSLMKDFFDRDHEATHAGYELPGGNAGWDGNSATGEIRPKPSYTPAGLADNIGRLYSEICQRAPKAVKLSVMSNTAPIGGHIHFELDEVSKQMSDQKARIVQKRLSSFYMPIAMSEDPLNIKYRVSGSGYGRYNDFRRENGKTYEYRTPSAEWQLTPKICNATLAYLGTVWYEAVHRPESFKNMDLIYPSDEVGNSLQQLTQSNYPLIRKAILNEAKRAVKKFEYYPMFHEEIDYIMNPEKVNKDKQAAHFCINIGWGFSPADAPTKRLINNERKINERLSSIDIDRWLELFKIPHNPDTNVKDFVDALKKRILAYDWSLKNEYYMFGMRKGVDKPIAMDGNGQFVLGHEQIRTICDEKAIKDSFARMRERMTRTVVTPNRNIILFGLPYDMRMKKKIREIIDIIYEMERKPLEPIALKSLSDDTDLPNEMRGSIFQAYLRDENAIVEEGSRNLDPRAMQRLIDESRLEADCDDCDDDQESND